MNRILKTFVLAGFALVAANCKKNDDGAIQVRDRQEVYDDDKSKIETFLKTKAFSFDENGNLSFEDISEGNSGSIWNQQEYPLQSVELKNDAYTSQTVTGRIKDDVSYKVYYVIINEGGGDYAKTIDDVYTKYTGFLLDGVTKFDQNDYGFWSSYPQTRYASNVELISGYRQILQQIKTASDIYENPDGTYGFNNAGRVIVFIPSGLGYFNTATGAVGGYTPIIFDISLIMKKEVDHDNDGILSKYEDINGNGNFWDDDTDGDGKPDFLDLDDDADGKTTREEITYETVDESGNVVKKLYEFDQIPNCPGGTVKKHLDKSCY